MSLPTVKDGRVVDVAAPANTNAGSLVLVGSIFGIALDTVLNGATVSLQTGGVWTLPKVNAASNAFTAGGKVYWDATNANVTPSATSNTLIGVATVARANTDATATVRLNTSFGI